MAEINNDKRNIKELSMTLLEIADCNLLLSTIGLKEDQVMKQIGEEVNQITWIFGHCASHMDYIFGELCQGKRLLTKEENEAYAYGVSKDKIKE